MEWNNNISIVHAVGSVHYALYVINKDISKFSSLKRDINLIILCIAFARVARNERHNCLHLKLCVRDVAVANIKKKHIEKKYVLI